MQKLDFNTGWTYRHLEEDETDIPVTLPHDAMCREERNLSSQGCHNVGWFEGRDYLYTKHFFIPNAYKEKNIIMEFEGVYHNAEIYVNKKKVAQRPYGYTNFYVSLDSYILYDAENEIQVIAYNLDQPNSRWYSGAGIYRPVWLYIGEKQYILVNGVKIRTLDYKRALMEIRVYTILEGRVEVNVFDEKGTLVQRGEANSVKNQKDELDKDVNRTCAVFQFEIPDAKLWNTELPTMYTCIAKCENDEVKETFGIRTVTWSKDEGIAINGEHVILKGACIHHDNGVLGACSFPEAEERRVRILRDTGYNALRMAHNPCSKALLEACDKQGMLVMDEYVDMWYIHKNKYDYASYMMEWWQEDLTDMVNKDYNHPSVILYSIGNEVAETGQKQGIDLTGEMTQYLHSIDGTRPVSCGINIFFNFLYAMGLGVYSDKKAEKKNKAVGSEFYNTLAGIFGDKAMKIGATLHMCDVKTRGAFAQMDIAGYNYGIFRYKHDLKKYPERLILGSETFCKDAFRFYELAKKEKRIVGDFVWAGMDYIGEAGIGAWEYSDYAPNGQMDPGWLTAGSGRIDILGYPNGEALYTKVVFEKQKGPFIAVRPVYQKGKHSPSAWKMTDAMESWSWPGCEGDRASVEVYARADMVELFVNGKSVGKKRMKNTCNVTFKTIYESGNIMAIAYDASGAEMGRHMLRTAGAETMLSILPEKESVAAGELEFIQLRYTDVAGIWKPMERHRIKVSVENGTLEGFGNACPYNPDGYWKDVTETYYGEAMAVVRAGKPGILKFMASDENNCYEVNIEII